MANATAPDVIGGALRLEPDLVFYDGGCGLCHHLVLFLLKHDLEGTEFRFSPIGSAAWDERMKGRTEQLPDSVVLCTADGRILFRSDAALHIGERIGGGWGALARGFGLLPRWLLDIAYDGVARVRKKLFAPPAGACPILPAELRSRFLQ